MNYFLIIVVFVTCRGGFNSRIATQFLIDNNFKSYLINKIRFS